MSNEVILRIEGESHCFGCHRPLTAILVGNAKAVFVHITNPRFAAHIEHSTIEVPAVRKAESECLNFEKMFKAPLPVELEEYKP